MRYLKPEIVLFYFSDFLLYKDYTKAHRILLYLSHNCASLLCLTEADTPAANGEKFLLLSVLLHI